jgi:hypothetical protein
MEANDAKNAARNTKIYEVFYGDIDAVFGSNQATFKAAKNRPAWW